MKLVRRVVGATAIAVFPRQSVASAWRCLVAPLLSVVVLLAASLGIAEPALAAIPTASNFGPGGTTYNAGSNPPLVFSVLPHVTGGATSFAMVSATSEMLGSVSITNAGTITYVPPVGFKGTDRVYYTASNADGTSAPATVHISVNWPVITVALPSNLATVGVPYNPGGTPLAISGGFAPYTITFSDPFPPGMSFNPATRVLSGTPTDAGGFAVNYTLADSSYGQTGNQVDNGWFTLTIDPPTIAVSPPTLAGSPTVGVAYSQAVTASGGTAPYSYTVTAGALPAGLVLSPVGVISGTPTASGAFNVTVTAIDNLSYTGSRPYSLTVAPPTITVSPPTLAGSPTIGAPYSQTLTAAGGIGPHSYTVTVGALPAGLVLSPVGVISGTPTAAGAFNVTVTAIDNLSYTGSRPYSLTVAAPPMILSAAPMPAGNVGAPYATSVTASGATAPYSYQVVAGALPTGLSLSASGAISGTPTAGGIFNFTIKATDSSTGVNAPFAAGGSYAIAITAPTVTVSPGGLLDSQVGQAYSAGITASGAQAPYSFAVTAGALPAGLSLGAGGALTGTPTATGTFNFTVTATDSNGFPATGSRNYNLTIVAPNLTLQPGVLSNATFGEAFSASFTAGGGSSPYSYQVTAGALPPGLNLSLTGLLSGTPTAQGTFNFSVTTTDSTAGAGPYSLAQAYSLLVAPPPPPIAGAGSLTLAANSPGEPVVVTLSGGTATGVAVGAVTATHGTVNIAGMTMTYIPNPGYSGPDSFTYTAFNVTGHSPEATVTVTVTPPTLTLSGLPTTGQVTAPYSGTAAASLGAAPYSFVLAAGALPASVILAGDGTLTGTPTAAGTFNFTLQATDAYGATGTGAYTVTIDAPTVAITAPAAGALPGVEAGTAYSQTFTLSGGQGAHSVSLTAGALPPGVTLSGAGVLSGTPTTPGTFNFSVTPRDSSGAPGPYFGAPQAYSLTVAAPTIVVSPAAGALPAGLITAPYSQAIAASGGVAPYGFAVTAGALPGGLTLSAAGVLGGTPTLVGSYGFSITATDAFGFDLTAAYTLEIGTPIPVPAAKTAALIAGQSVTIDAAAGATGSPFTAVTVTTAPAHGTAVVSGLTIVYTPNGAYTGPDSFAYTLTNAGGPSLPATVSIMVNPAIVAGPPKRVTILAGQTATVELTEGATGAPFTGAAVVSLSPADAGTATITGRSGPSGQLYDLVFKPDNDFSGQAVVTYTLSNAFATSAPGAVTITVEPRPDPTQDPEVSALIAAQTDTARRFATAQLSNINRRLEGLHGGAGGTGDGFSSSLGFSGGNSALGGGLASDPSELRKMQDSEGVIGALTGRRAFGFDGRAPASVAEDRRAFSEQGEGAGPWSVWVSGAASFGTSDAAANREGFEFDTDGLTIGADRRFGERLVLGGGLGWAHDASEIGDNGTRSEADAWSLSLYGSYQPTKAAFLDLVLGYGQLDFDSRRYVTANGDFAIGQRDGGQWYGALTAGWDYRHPQGLHLSPYGRVEASRSTLDNFTEEGGGSYALHYDEQSTTMVIGALGLKGDYALETGFGRAIPSFRIEYAYDLKGSGAARIRYADWLDGEVYSMTATPYGKNRMLYGLGLDMLRESGMRFGLDYEGTLSDDQTGHTVRILLETPF